MDLYLLPLHITENRIVGIIPTSRLWGGALHCILPPCAENPSYATDVNETASLLEAQDCHLFVVVCPVSHVGARVFFVRRR